MPTGAQQIRDLVQLRQINEGAALRLSMERGDAAWEGGILAAHHRLKSAGLVGAAAWHRAVNRRPQHEARSREIGGRGTRRAIA